MPISMSMWGSPSPRSPSTKMTDMQGEGTARDEISSRRGTARSWTSRAPSSRTFTTASAWTDELAVTFEFEAKRKREADFKRRQQERKQKDLDKRKAEKEERRMRDERLKADLNSRAAAASAQARIFRDQARARLAWETSRQKHDDIRESNNRVYLLAKAKEMADAHRKKTEREVADQAAREKQAADDRARERTENLKYEEHLEQSKQKTAADMRAEKRRLAREDAKQRAEEKAEADRVAKERARKAITDRAQAEAEKRAAEREEARQNYERQMIRIEEEQKVKDDWAAVRGDVSKAASTVAFEAQMHEETKRQHESAAWHAVAALEQNIRLEREKSAADLQRREREINEREGKRVRENVLLKKRQAAEQRKRDVAEASRSLKLHAEAEASEQAVLEKTRQREAIKARQEADRQKAEAERLKALAKAKQAKVDRERTLKGDETSIALKRIKDSQEAEQAKARRAEWEERQARDKAALDAQAAKLHESQKAFTHRSHGQHLTSTLGGSWSEPENVLDMREAKKRFAQVVQDREQAEAEKRAAEREYVRQSQEKLKQIVRTEQKVKDDWAAVRGDVSKAASTVAFEAQMHEETKRQHESAAWHAVAALEQNIRLEREKSAADLQRREREINEREGKRVRENVLLKKRQAAEQRKRDVAEASRSLKLHAEAEASEQAVLEKTRQREAIKARQEADRQKAEAERLKALAKAKQAKVDRERTLKGDETSIALKRIKDSQAAEQAKARRAEWQERQKRHEEETKAEIKHLHDVQVEFANRAQGHHLSSTCW